jgi:hypothetical protein
MASPLAILMLIIVDLVFIFNTAFLELAFEIAYILSYGLIDFRYISAIIDSSYVILFGMQRVDIEGFRRMRTIHQLAFETIVQLGLQLRMLQYFGSNSSRS